MKHRLIWNFAIIFGAIVTAIGATLMLLPNQSYAQGGGVGAQTVTGTAFTYQGRLMYNSTPISGTCDLTFRLRDAAVSGTQVGTNFSATGVPVSDGYFSVGLDFGSSAFTGEARWLEIAIDSCTGGASGIVLNPLVELKPAPYALSLRPGAVISGTVSGNGLEVVNSSANANAIGIYGETASDIGKGVMGYATATNGWNVGVYGKTASATGDGVRGYATTTSGVAYGVSGESNSPDGVGVYGTAPTTGTVGIATNTSGATYGVYGQSDSAHFNGIGVYGRATAASGATKGVYGQSDSGSSAASGVFGLAAANSGQTYGVLGQTLSNQGAGVYGVGIITGTYGLANTSSGASYGVYGQSNSPSGYGVYSNGNAHVEGQLTWKPITSYLSLPAAAFNPTADGGGFNQQGLSLTPFGALPATTYAAPVDLPHGATVTNLTFYWADASSSTGYANLFRIDLAGNETEMATASTTGSSGAASSSSDTTINTATIDNSQYAYYIWLSLPDTGVTAYGVVIEYTIDRPY